MKLVIYGHYGGFYIPKELEDHFKKLLGDDFRKYRYSGNEPIRTDEKFIEYVRNNDTEFAIADIPENATDYMIDKYDGLETVYYVLDGKIHEAEWEKRNG